MKDPSSFSDIFCFLLVFSVEKDVIIRNNNSLVYNNLFNTRFSSIMQERKEEKNIISNFIYDSNFFKRCLMGE